MVLIGGFGNEILLYFDLLKSQIGLLQAEKTKLLNID